VNKDTATIIISSVALAITIFKLIFDFLIGTFFYSSRVRVFMEYSSIVDDAYAKLVEDYTKYLIAKLEPTKEICMEQQSINHESNKTQSKKSNKTEIDKKSVKSDKTEKERITVGNARFIFLENLELYIYKLNNLCYLVCKTKGIYELFYLRYGNIIKKIFQFVESNEAENNNSNDLLAKVSNKLKELINKTMNKSLAGTV